MSTSGYGIKDDDTTSDVISLVDEFLRDGATLTQAFERVLAMDDMRGVQNDEELMTLINLGFAYAAWAYGSVPKPLYESLCKAYENELGHEAWADVPRRRKAIAQFLSRIATRNPKPRAIPKGPRHKQLPGYRKGDCLAVRMPDGKYTAIYVLQPVQYGSSSSDNIVVELDYVAVTPPSLIHFKAMRPVSDKGLFIDEIQVTRRPPRSKAVNEFISVVGNISLSWPEIDLQLVDKERGVWANMREPAEDDPADLGRYIGGCAWTGLGEAARRHMRRKKRQETMQAKKYRK